MPFIDALKATLFGSSVAPAAAPVASHLPREDEAFSEIWRHCQPYTMTSFERGLAVFRSVRHIVENKIDGDIVECGVWRGGSSMIAMMSLMHFGADNRRIVMLDTYEGMTEPSARDVDPTGVNARELLASEGGRADGVLCYASLEEVQLNVMNTGYPRELVELIKGDIRMTAANVAARDIALLRLDTDFYDSTKVELETFYPQLKDGGVLIVDDYGHWAGSREAVDEYFAAMRAKGETSPFLTIIDYTGRLGVK